MPTLSTEICTALEDIDTAVDQINRASMLKKPALIEELVPKIQNWAQKVTTQQGEHEYRLSALEGVTSE